MEVAKWMSGQTVGIVGEALYCTWRGGGCLSDYIRTSRLGSGHVNRTGNFAAKAAM